MAKAEAAVLAHKLRNEGEIREFRYREAALRAEGERLRKRQNAEADKLAKRLTRAKDRYAAALALWSGETITTIR